MDLLISRRKVININFNPRYFIFDPFYFKFIYFGICISFKLTIFFFPFISSRLKSSSKIAENESNVLTSF